MVIRIDGPGDGDATDATLERRSSGGFAPLPADRLANPHHRFASRPSEMLPWADPTIAGLVRRLQNDVRSERAATSRFRAPAADLDPPSPTPDFDLDWEAWDAPRWTRLEESN
ncbi:MAG: hypothetical protein KF847_02240 [Pirellulales bacterium]|nr:hypothetical protein [Pirellulales bacterium]